MCTISLSFLPLLNVDANECLLHNGDCLQTCKNTNGSFQCSCMTGFELNVDNRTCNGKNIHTVYLFYVPAPFMQTSMNACPIMEDVLNNVQIQMVALYVPAHLDMLLMPITRPAMVCCNHQFQSNYSIHKHRYKWVSSKQWWMFTNLQKHQWKLCVLLSEWLLIEFWSINLHW